MKNNALRFYKYISQQYQYHIPFFLAYSSAILSNIYLIPHPYFADVSK
jgi:hypothetical protein